MSDDQPSGDAPEAPPRPPVPESDATPPEQDKAENEEKGDSEEKGAKEKEREAAAERFKEFTRDPLAEEQSRNGPTDLAGASRTRRATQLLFESGRDLTSIDRSVIRSAHIGDVFLGADALRRGSGMRSGPVPADELRTLRRVHVVPDGYVRLRNALRARRLLVLGAAPGTGRTSTALSLLAEVTDTEPDAGPRVLRVDPDDGVRKLSDSLRGEGEERGRRGTGYLLELSLTRPGALPPDAMDLDELAGALARCEAFAVVVVTVGSAAGPLLAGRYGMLCPPAPTQELLTTRLRERLEDHVAAHPEGTAGVEELLTRAEELADREAVVDAVGLTDLRPAEAELLASLLAGQLLGDLSYEELLAGCRSLAAAQAQEWFAGVDRALAAPAGEGDEGPRRPGTAALFHPVAFRIALAVLGGASHSVVASAAYLLNWELSSQCDPDHTPARTLFGDDPVADLALSRAELTDGAVEVAGVEVPARLIWYRGGALPSAVLSELWDRHFPAREPVVRWLRQLADDPRQQVWMRAAVAAGELCVRDFEYGYDELLRKFAESEKTRRRVFAATVLAQVAGHAAHRRAVCEVVAGWSEKGTKALRWTAAMALGYGNTAATTDEALDALADFGLHDNADQLALASLNVVRLLALPDSTAVLRRMSDWTHDRRPEYQDLGLAATVRLTETTVDKVLTGEPGSPLSGRGDWPLPLALAAAQPELALLLADLMWTALNTARSSEVAGNRLATLLRSAVREDGTEWTRPGLAALLPTLAAGEGDRRRLDWLLRRLMNDPDNPLPEARARDLWRLAVAPRDRLTGEEESHG